MQKKKEKKTIPTLLRDAADKNSIVGGLMKRRPDIRPVVAWLRKHDSEPEPMLAGAAQRLKKRGHHLPENQRDLYFAKVLLNEFLTRWVRHNRGRKVADWIDKYTVRDEQAYEEQLKPFEMVVLMLCDAAAFRKQVPTMVRMSEAARSNIPIGDGVGFEGFAADNTWMLANRLLVNFNPNRPNANRGAVNYLLKTAMSSYLKHESEDPDFASAGMMGYLKESRVDPRNVIAYKLVYSPSHLSFKERKWLREKHGIKDLTRRYRVKDAAALLGYKNPQSLSRKFNKIRKWAELDLMAESAAGGVCYE